jgi:hypothetical protein
MSELENDTFFRKCEAVFRQVFPQHPDASLDRTAKFPGAIGDSMRITVGKDAYCFKIRTRNDSLGYSKKCLQEPLVYAAIQAGRVSNLETLRRTYQSGQAVKAPRNWLLDILHHEDISCPKFGVPWMITRWMPGGPLLDQPTLLDERILHLYQQAGSLLASVHAIESSIVSDDLSGGLMERPHYSLREHIFYSIATLATELNFDALRVAAILKAAYVLSAELDPKAELDPNTKLAKPVLIHNDFWAGNLLLDSDDRLVLIDWDNSGLGLAELDFVKMYYWSYKDADGFLAPSRERFEAFRKGYDLPRSLRSFNLCRLLWLLKIINFERGREARKTRKKPFPPPEYYEPLLDELLRSPFSPPHGVSI